ncbi:hypothetical protein A3770_19p83500 [Chloropicon primus]|uniref:Uncharacterized protein n=1 Tax=Chloropicon primus TaxID=1764295 RepID=A0A5B8N165_9CHLO|nr:hypothetical protein A3770_19p83500 [Chloropicon primus]|eukprot:QDZ25832.1 hypothetical protein A3770_19p83500 [Chloropicon primus]
MEEEGRGAPEALDHEAVHLEKAVFFILFCSGFIYLAEKKRLFSKRYAQLMRRMSQDVLGRITRSRTWA